MTRRCFFVFSFFVAALFATTAHAHVKASLVAGETSIAPGRPFTVALKLEHESHWHTYWINPGTGYPTSLAWTLPEGWSASEIQWPTPIVIKDSKGNVTGNGYDGTAYLPVTITPSANAQPGETITLRAKAEWLMCADICIPGAADVELTLPIKAEAPSADPAHAAALAAIPLPQTAEGWTISARSDGKNVLLRLVRSRSDATPALTDPHFFSEDGFIQYDQPQQTRLVENGIELFLPVSPSADTNTARLTGVLSSQKPFGGLRIDMPLEKGDVAFATTAATGPDAGATSAGPATGLFATLAIGFLGGLILNLMPCVFPVLGIKILGFVNQAGAARRKVVLHGLVFTSGILLSFWVLAGVLAALRSGGAELGWGFQLQSPAFVYLLAAVMLAFALNLSGVFEFGLSATAVGGSLHAKTGYSGSFFTGVLATVVATPCSAPFLAPALGAALTLTPTQSFAVFTAIALGLATPYLLLSIFPQAIKLLPRPGAWMETFKQFMAFPLYATVGYLVWVLAGQLAESGLLSALFGLVLVAMGTWVYGRWASPGSAPRRRAGGLIVCVALLAAGAAIGYPREAAANEIVWEKWSPEAVAALREDGRIVYVDFTARWCATCQTNKKLVFGSDEVKRTFAEKRVAALKADWTNKDAQITAELARFNRNAVPFNLVYKPGSAEPLVLPELLTPATVLQALQ